MASRIFSRPPAARSLSSLLPSFLGSSSAVLNDNSGSYIRSVAVTAPSDTGERTVWVLGEERMQQWIMKPEGWEEKVLDENVSESVKIVLQDSATAQEDNLDLELLDLAIDE